MGTHASPSVNSIFDSFLFKIRISKRILKWMPPKFSQNLITGFIHYVFITLGEDQILLDAWCKNGPKVDGERRVSIPRTFMVRRRFCGTMPSDVGRDKYHCHWICFIYKKEQHCTIISTGLEEANNYLWSGATSRRSNVAKQFEKDR